MFRSGWRQQSVPVLTAATDTAFDGAAHGARAGERHRAPGRPVARWPLAQERRDLRQPASLLRSRTRRVRPIRGCSYRSSLARRGLLRATAWQLRFASCPGGRAATTRSAVAAQPHPLCPLVVKKRAHLVGRSQATQIGSFDRCRDRRRVGRRARPEERRRRRCQAGAGASLGPIVV
jgi:hypothetical protein